MNKPIYIVCFCLAVTTGLAQEEVQWGPDYKTSGNTYHSKVIGVSDSSFFALRIEGKSANNPQYYLEKYSVASLEMEWENQLIMPEVFGSPSRYEELLFIDGHLYLFVTAVDAVRETYSAYAHAIDGSGNLSQVSTELSVANVSSPRDTGKYRFIPAQDGKQLLIYYNPPFEKYTNKELFFSVWNSAMEQEWTTAIELPFIDLSFDITKCVLTANEDIFLMSETTAEKGDDQVGITGRSYTVIAYFKDANTIKEYEITLGGKYITSAAFSTDDLGDLLIAGFYSNDKEFSMAGTFFLRINAKTRKMESQSIKEFSADFTTQFVAEKELEEDKELTSFYLDHFLIMEDGSTRLVAEKYYEYTTSYYNWQTGLITYDYHYVFADIIVVGVSRLGAVEWESHIPKVQHTTDDSGYYSSYAVATSNNNLIFLYNDDPGNEDGITDETQTIKTMDNPAKALAMYASVDELGAVSRSALFNSKEIETILRPQFYKQLDDGLMLIFGERGKNYQFGLLR